MLIRSCLNLWIVALLLSAPLLADAEERGGEPNKSKYDSYIVLMDLKPAIAYDGDVKGFKATKAPSGKKFNPNSARAREYAKMLTEEHDELLEATGIGKRQKVHDYTMSVNGFSARMTHEQAKALHSHQFVILCLHSCM